MSRAGSATIAPAKINWTLEVLERRADGYHELRSVMQSLSLHDDLRMTPDEQWGIEVTEDGAGAPAGPDNLALRAARLFQQRFGGGPRSLALTKRIPSPGGLGGGSSDAAAVLRLLAAEHGVDLGDVAEIAASLGADVSFFLRGGVQLAAGKGERLTPLPDPPPVKLALLIPPLDLPGKTARLYRALTAADYSSGAATARLAAHIEAGGTPGPAWYVNGFDRVADVVFMDLPRYRAVLEEATGQRACLAGAGPGLFAVVPASLDATRLARIRSNGVRVIVTATTGALGRL